MTQLTKTFGFHKIRVFTQKKSYKGLLISERLNFGEVISLLLWLNFLNLALNMMGA